MRADKVEREGRHSEMRRKGSVSSSEDWFWNLSHCVIIYGVHARVRALDRVGQDGPRREVGGHVVFPAHTVISVMALASLLHDVPQVPPSEDGADVVRVVELALDVVPREVVLVLERALSLVRECLPGGERNDGSAQ